MKIEIDIDVHVDMDEEATGIDDRQVTLGRRVTFLVANPTIDLEREEVCKALVKALRTFEDSNSLHTVKPL